MRRVILLAFLLMVQAVAAGSSTDPEITDDSGDGAGPKDIVSFWIDEIPVLDSEDRPSLVFHYTIADDSPDLTSLFTLHERFRVGFTGDYPDAPSGEMYVIAEPAVGTTSQTGEDRLICNFGVGTAEGESGQPELGMDEGAWTGTHFICIVPYEYLGATGGETLTTFWGAYEVVSRGPLAGDDQIGVNVVPVDRAPDSAYGRDFVMPMLATEDDLPVSFTDLDGPLLQLDQGFSEPRTQAFVWNWTTATPLLNATVNVTVAGGEAGVHILDAQNETVFACNCTEGDTASFTAAGNGTWTIRLDAQAFQGNLTVDAVPLESGGDGTRGPESNAAAGTSDQNSTSAPAGQEDTPIPAALVVAAVFVAARRRWR